MNQYCQNTRPLVSNVHPVFVYGSLKQGGYNHHYLSGASSKGQMKTRETFLMVSLGAYPGILRNEGTRYQVAGELYLVSPLNLEQLDKLEDEGTEYRREKIVLEEYPEEVWCYLLAERNPEQWIRDPVNIEVFEGLQQWRV